MSKGNLLGVVPDFLRIQESSEMSLITFGHVSSSEIVISPKILPGCLTVSFLNFFSIIFSFETLFPE